MGGETGDVACSRSPICTALHLEKRMGVVWWPLDPKGEVLVSVLPCVFILVWLIEPILGVNG